MRWTTAALPNELKVCRFRDMMISNEYNNHKIQWAIRSLFSFIFVFSMQSTVNDKILTVTGFEPQISEVKSKCSTNCATSDQRCYSVAVIEARTLMNYRPLIPFVHCKGLQNFRRHIFCQRLSVLAIGQVLNRSIDR